MPDLRIGHGYDVHAFCQGRSLVLGGVTIPYIKGLHGHSDADVLTHAVCDAILGAAGLRDIGYHFPDTDPAYKNIRSIGLLERVVELAAEKGFHVVNVDITVIAEQPKVQPHVNEIKAVLEPVLSASGGPGEVNVKATTNEGMGFLGRGEGIVAHAVALLIRP